MEKKFTTLAGRNVSLLNGGQLSSEDNAADNQWIQNKIALEIYKKRFKDLESLENFIKPNFSHEISCYPDLLDEDKATARLAKAFNDDEDIAIISDYDVDGSSAAAIFVNFWGEVNKKTPTVYIPERLTDGYGPNEEAFDCVQKANVKLVLMFDCGSSSFDFIKKVIDSGCQVIVLDHHGIDERLFSLFPNLILVNPSRLEATQEFINISATSVVFMVLYALRRLLNLKSLKIGKYLDLVALASVCDMMPMLGLNRALTQLGLRAMTSVDTNLGLSTMLKKLAITNQISCRDLAFMIGPRLNAGSRMGKSRLAFELLTASDAKKAMAICDQLEGLNKLRQEETGKAFERLQLDPDRVVEEGKAVLVVDDMIHPGVMGLVASQVMDRFSAPALVVTCEGGVYRGSARAPEGYNLGALMQELSKAKILSEGGGHKAAAGFTVAEGKVPDLKEYIKANKMQDQLKIGNNIYADAIISLKDIDFSLVGGVSKFAPFGPKNEEPLFILERAAITGVRIMKEKHIKLFLPDNNIEAIGFNIARRSRHLFDHLKDAEGRELTFLLVTVSKNIFRGKETITLKIVDAGDYR